MARKIISNEWYGDVPRSARTPTLFGFSVMALTLFGFGYWANTALIAGAIVSSGSFVATGENKIIQHLEGGVIKEILVREGDVVERGQVLIELDETAPKAELRRLVLREAQAVARQSRLKAEIDEKDEIDFPEFLRANANDPDFNEILERERQALRVRRTSLKTEIATFQQGIEALKQRISGGKTQLEYIHKQLGYFEEELEAKTELAKRGLIRKPEVLALQRAQANMNGEVGRLTGEIGDAHERIARVQEQITSVRNQAMKTIMEEMHQSSGELKDVRERIRSAEALVGRVNIAAPVNGVVVRLKYHTSGGVIEAGKSIMEILPLQEELIIEARVQPKDIDSVKKGQSAIIRLSAMNRRITPMIAGEVVYVSADSISNESQGTGQSDVYLARVQLNPIDVSKVLDFKPTPGMPAEVFIKTADRTFLEYLTKPIIDSMNRAFRES